jgi:nitrogen fixation protein NifU and related proteins
MAGDMVHFSTKPVSKDKEQPVSVPGQALQSWLGPYNEGIIDQPEGLAVVTGPCGDTMEISLRIEKNRITDSRFRVKGCAVSRACASNASALAKGKELETAWDIEENDISRNLPELPVDHQHCAVLARDTLRQAIENYLKQAKGQRL